MKRKIFFITVAAAMLALSSCIIIDGEIVAMNSFNHSLHGTWKTSSGDLSLEISIYSITITGPTNFGEPLHGFVRNISLSGYSEETTNSIWIKEGNIHIRNAGRWENPIPYRYEAIGTNEVLVLRGAFISNNLNFYKQ